MGRLMIIGTRVPLDMVALVDVYAVLACYLRHRVAVEAHLAEQERGGAGIQAFMESVSPGWSARQDSGAVGYVTIRFVADETVDRAILVGSSGARSTSTWCAFRTSACARPLTRWSCRGRSTRAGCSARSAGPARGRCRWDVGALERVTEGLLLPSDMRSGFSISLWLWLWMVGCGRCVGRYIGGYSADGRHGGDFPVRWHLELSGQAVSIEGPELAYREAQVLSLEGHVRDGLSEVVDGELGVVPCRVLDVSV
jgi:hypothetical protein